MRKFLKRYTGYSTSILREFMTEKELNELTRKYNEVKISRLQKKLDEKKKKFLCINCGHKVEGVRDRR